MADNPEDIIPEDPQAYLNDIKKGMPIPNLLEASKAIEDALKSGIAKPTEVISKGRAESLARDIGIYPSADEVVSYLTNLPLKKTEDGKIEAPYSPLVNIEGEIGEAAKDKYIEPLARKAVDEAQAQGIQTVSSGYDNDKGVGWVIGIKDGKTVRFESQPDVWDNDTKSFIDNMTKTPKPSKDDLLDVGPMMDRLGLNEIPADVLKSVATDEVGPSITKLTSSLDQNKLSQYVVGQSKVRDLLNPTVPEEVKLRAETVERAYTNLPQEVIDKANEIYNLNSGAGDATAKERANEVVKLYVTETMRKWDRTQELKKQLKLAPQDKVDISTINLQGIDIADIDTDVIDFTKSASIMKLELDSLEKNLKATAPYLSKNWKEADIENKGMAGFGDGKVLTTKGEINYEPFITSEEGKKAIKDLEVLSRAQAAHISKVIKDKWNPLVGTVGERPYDIIAGGIVKGGSAFVKTGTLGIVDLNSMAQQDIVDSISKSSGEFGKFTEAAGVAAGMMIPLAGATSAVAKGAQALAKVAPKTAAIISGLRSSIAFASYNGTTKVVENLRAGKSWRDNVDDALISGFKDGVMFEVLGVANRLALSGVSNERVKAFVDNMAQGLEAQALLHPESFNDTASTLGSVLANAFIAHHTTKPNKTAVADYLGKMSTELKANPDVSKILETSDTIKAYAAEKKLKPADIIPEVVSHITDPTHPDYITSMKILDEMMTPIYDQYNAGVDVSKLLGAAPTAAGTLGANSLGNIFRALGVIDKGLGKFERETLKGYPTKALGSLLTSAKWLGIGAKWTADKIFDNQITGNKYQKFKDKLGYLFTTTKSRAGVEFANILSEARAETRIELTNLARANARLSKELADMPGEEVAKLVKPDIDGINVQDSYIHIPEYVRDFVSKTGDVSNEVLKNWVLRRLGKSPIINPDLVHDIRLARENNSTVDKIFDKDAKISDIDREILHTKLAKQINDFLQPTRQDIKILEPKTVTDILGTTSIKVSPEKLKILRNQKIGNDILFTGNFENDVPVFMDKDGRVNIDLPENVIGRLRRGFINKPFMMTKADFNPKKIQEIATDSIKLELIKQEFTNKKFSPEFLKKLDDIPGNILDLIWNEKSNIKDDPTLDAAIHSINWKDGKLIDRPYIRSLPADGYRFLNFKSYPALSNLGLDKAYFRGDIAPEIEKVVNVVSGAWKALTYIQNKFRSAKISFSPGGAVRDHLGNVFTQLMADGPDMAAKVWDVSGYFGRSVFENPRNKRELKDLPGQRLPSTKEIMGIYKKYDYDQIREIINRDNLPEIRLDNIQYPQKYKEYFIAELVNSDPEGVINPEQATKTWDKLSKKLGGDKAVRDWALANYLYKKGVLGTTFTDIELNGLGESYDPGITEGKLLEKIQLAHRAGTALSLKAKELRSLPDNINKVGVFLVHLDAGEINGKKVESLDDISNHISKFYQNYDQIPQGYRNFSRALGSIGANYHAENLRILGHVMKEHPWRFLAVTMMPYLLNKMSDDDAELYKQSYGPYTLQFGDTVIDLNGSYPYASIAQSLTGSTGNRYHETASIFNIAGLGRERGVPAVGAVDTTVDVITPFVKPFTQDHMFEQLGLAIYGKQDSWGNNIETRNVYKELVKPFVPTIVNNVYDIWTKVRTGRDDKNQPIDSVELATRIAGVPVNKITDIDVDRLYDSTKYVVKALKEERDRALSKYKDTHTTVSDEEYDVGYDEINNYYQKYLDAVADQQDKILTLSKKAGRIK